MTRLNKKEKGKISKILRDINLTPSFETIFQVKSLHFTCEVLSKAVNIIETDSVI